VMMTRGTDAPVSRGSQKSASGQATVAEKQAQEMGNGLSTRKLRTRDSE
jgi:hypothetical protein